MEVKENVFHETHSGGKTELGEKLGYLLADHFALYIKTLNCHWNVVDPRFHSLHEMFEEQYAQLAEQNDLIAERIRQLDIFVQGSLSEFSKKASLDEVKRELDADEMIRSLIKSYQQHCADIKTVIADAEEKKDASTSDILVEILRSLEKNLWMLKSHL